MELWKLKSIFYRYNRFITLNELYEEFSRIYDISQYVDYRAAIRTELYRNCIDRELNLKSNKVFVSLKFKGAKGQEYGLYEWIKQETIHETSEVISDIQKSPAFYMLNNIKKVARDENVKRAAFERADFLCEFNNDHITFVRKKDGKNYTELHHLIPLELQSDEKFKNINLDCMANVVSLCSNCHNQIHYGAENLYLLSKLYALRKAELEAAGINISLEELLSYYQ